jgi:GR25 family glycosyltransferase involved in LPS biosynthesis
MSYNIYFMTMPERLYHVKSQVTELENSIIIDSFNDLEMHIPETYVLNFNLKRKELCAYTYIFTLQSFLESNKDTCIIFEDDIVIKKALKNDIDKLMDICKMYDFIYLYRPSDNYKKIININGIEFIDNISDGNLAIMWSRNGAKKFLDNLPMKIAKDYWIKKQISNGIFNALTTKYNYVDNIGAINNRDKTSLMGSTIYNIKPCKNNN